MIKFGFLVLLFLLLVVSVQANQASHSQLSPYSGQESRIIKSLSSDDIAELKRGGGWGLAKAAELNGVPGPAHLLELKDEIPLSKAQTVEITRLYEGMKARAIELGERLITLERELENQFQTGRITDSSLRESLQAIADVRMDLRYVHLATHLQTPDILTAAQIDKYNALRGYGAKDPCQNIPQGHDPAMWRKHNGCE